MELFIVHRNISNPSTSKIPWDHLEKIDIAKGLYLSYRKDLVEGEDYGNWFFLWYGEFDAKPDLSLLADRLDSDRAAETWGGRGVCIAINKIKAELKIINDSYGSFPIFFSKSPIDSDVIASNSIKAFNQIKIDWTSFYQFLSFGYIIGEFSIFNNVSRLMANSMLAVSGNSNEINIKVNRLENFWLMGGEVTEDKVDSIIDILRFEAGKIDRSLLMMSGGWDSRLLLSAMKDVSPVLYTHGNLASREIAIVRDIANLLRLELIEHDFSCDNFDDSLFQGYLEKNESMMFSHWAEAGRLASTRSLVMTAGTFGEVLGGHYGTLNSLPPKKKYLSLAAHMLGLGGFVDRYLHLEDIEQVYELLKVSNYNVFWMVRDEISERLKTLQLMEDSNDRLNSVLTSYREQGTDNAQAIYERFYTEHRGGQYINLQMKNAAVAGRFRNAFTNRDLIAVVSSIKFEDRAHNKLNKKVVRKICPELLKFPLAATLANAGRPLLVQEISRATRKFIEKNNLGMTLYSKMSVYGGRKFGWNDFEAIVSPELANGMLANFQSDLWDRDAIVGASNSKDSGMKYPLFDMLSKALTLDFSITPQRPIE
ncbi:hypothetical protein [Marinobacter sediminum]|uniref:hypothetical protein n=1 Tax=Marinobacter sediminum TaxID=256323 RepID=UPI0019395B81|nr:hypothetical protein [Marinobacter sediminum]